MRATPVQRSIAASMAALAAGCLPFFGGKGEPPRTPAAVERFADAARALDLPPSPPPLPTVTRLLADAIESLPATPEARKQGEAIDAEAHAMQSDAAENEKHARRSVEQALEALEHMKKPAGSKKERERALGEIRTAVGVDDSYRAVARALVLFGGGRPGLPAGTTLPALVALFSVEDDDLARRTGAQAVEEIGVALRALHVDAGNLDRRAARLAGAEPIDYTPALHDALAEAVTALDRHKTKEPAFTTLTAEAHRAVERIALDRPFELQRPAAQDALRLISDAITVASATNRSGR